MNLKIKILLPFLALTLFMLHSGNAFAQDNSVPITGTAYGDKIGLLHFDYTTAKRPSSASTFNDPKYYVGPTKQFYIHPYDAAGAKNTDFTGPGDEDVVARISTLRSDCTISGCNLKGFVWSDTIGWIALDGKAINDSLNEAIGFDPADDDTTSDPYKSQWYPRIKTTGAITGIAWNKYTGWILLSSSLVSGTTTPTGGQSAENFGAWLELSASPLYMKSERIGRPLHGYVWSENLGWIKLGLEADTFSFNFQTYTNWYPDNTPPVILASALAWFSVGVNTGYDPTVGSPTFNDNPTLVVWKNFAIDPESGVNESGSRFKLSAITGETDSGCPITLLSPLTTPIRLSPSIQDSAQSDLAIPIIGTISDSEAGYCKYELTAKVLNAGSNVPRYIGDTFHPNPLPTNPDEIAEIEANTIDEPIVVYVRAGNPDLTKTEVVRSLPVEKPSILADGVDNFTYTVQLKDIAENPIRSIHCGTSSSSQYQYIDCPNREVEVAADITNKLRYDLTQDAPSDWDTTEYPTPVLYSDTDPGFTGTFLKSNDPPIGVNWYTVLKGFNLAVASFAPSTTYDINAQAETSPLDFFISQFSYAIDNTDPLPATSKIYISDTEMPDDPDTVVPAYALDQTNTAMPSNNLTPAPYLDMTAGGLETAGLITKLDYSAPTSPALSSIKISFTPAVTVSNPQLTSELKGSLSLGVPSNLEYTVSNLSTKAIAVGANDGALSIDHIFTYDSNSGSASMALMETHRITDFPNTDPEQGWSDPLEGVTRYEMVGGQGCFTTDFLSFEPCTPENSPFRGLYGVGNSYIPSSHPGLDFCYDNTPDFCTAPNTINPNGTYAISGIYSIPQEYQPLIDPVTKIMSYPFPDKAGRIDRSDIASLALNAVPSTITKVIQFTPEKFVSATISDIQLKLYQDIAYRYGDQPFFAVYTSELATDYNVLDIGLEAKGTVSGEQIVTGRKFDTIGSAGTKKLQEQIRRNVSQMTSGGKSACSIPTDARTAFPDTTDPCVTYDLVNNNAFAFYEGGPTETLVLEDTSDGIIDAPVRPDNASLGLPYTIIIKGGANLFIKSNLRYPLDGLGKEKLGSSLGFILIAENIGQGANVYLSPEPTNLVGALYAEGSLLSMSSVDNKFYYGSGGGDVQELKNQLFWQGSLASRNTIGGAGIKKVPNGIECLPGDTEIECAQRYDLDYLRRFTAVVETSGTDTIGPSTIANNGKFSGGGCCGTTGCSASTGTCALGGTLPTVVELSGNKIDKANSELATVYIEPSTRTTNNPPPGFTVGTGLESKSVLQ